MGAPEPPVSSSRFNLPNVITVSRIALCPVLFWLAMSCRIVFEVQTEMLSVTPIEDSH